MSAELSAHLSSDTHQRKVCWTCGVALTPCLCPLVKPLTSRSEWLILMHPKEFKYERCGTGRLLQASLSPSKRFVGVNFDLDQEWLNELRKESHEQFKNTFVLWPSKQAQTVAQVVAESQASGEGFKSQTAYRFILIDGTWPAAKKIFNQSRCLQGLPQIQLTAPGLSEFVIKQQPRAGCLSTLECAVKLLLELSVAGIEDDQDWQRLLTPFRWMQKQQCDLASDPERGGYRRKAYQIDSVRERQLRGTRSRLR